MARREGFHTVTPYIIYKSAATAIDFYKTAFGAEEVSRYQDENGLVRHAEIRIGDSHVMLVDECPEFPDMRSAETIGASPVHIFLYLEDVDAFAARALTNGAELHMNIEEKDYGRSGGLKDPFGITWWITQHR